MTSAPASSSRFGTLLKHYRRMAGLTQEALAEQARLSVRGIQDLERGVSQAPRPDTVELLAAALGLSAEERAALVAAGRRLLLPPAHLGRAAPVSPGALVPLVGRQRELVLLAQFLAGAGDLGQAAPLLMLAGEPGIGKTRLLQAAAQQAIRQGWSVLVGGCHRRGGQEPYAPLLDALAQHLQAQRPDRLRAVLSGCAWLVRLLPELAEVLAPLPAGTLAPEQERRLLFAAVARLLANVAGPAGTLLVLDDLQWAGPDALDLLATLVRSPLARAQGAGLLRVVGAYRDTEVRAADPLGLLLADLAQAGQARHHALGPLPAEEAAALLDDLLANVALGDQAVVARVLQRAGGTPFFLVSYAQAVRAGSVEAAEVVPWDLAQGVHQRMALLPVVGQELLGAAAIVGRRAPRTLLVAATGQPEEAVLAGLEAACRARLLLEDGDNAYAFTHDVVREVVEAEVGAARRAVLHRRVAEALERGPGEPPVEEVAYHYARSGEHAAAARWLEWAGDRAAAVFANAAALAHYTTACEHLPAAPTDAATRAALARLNEKLGDLRVREGAYAQAQEDFARARAQATEPARRAELWHKESVTWGKRGEFARALALLDTAEGEVAGEAALPPAVRVAIELSRGELSWQQGEPGAAEDAVGRALALLSAESPSAARDLAMARAEALLGDMAVYRGEHVRAEEHLRRSLTLREQVGDQEGIGATWHNLGWVANERGALAEAEACFRRSLAVMERIEDDRGVADSCRSLAWVAYNRGALAEAEAYFRRELDLRERLGHPGGIAGAWNGLGWVACERGELTAAAAWCRRARRLARRSDFPWVEVDASLGQARAYLCGVPSAARRRTATALLAHGRTLATAHKWTLLAAQAALLVAELQLRSIRVDRGLLPAAQASAEEALRLAMGGQMRREEAVARRLLGRCALCRGAADQAMEHLRAALARQREMGADLEAARTRLVLAEVLATGVERGSSLEEVDTLLAEAETQLARSGAALDVAEAEQVAALCRQAAAVSARDGCVK